MQPLVNSEVKANLEHLITDSIDEQRAYEKAAELIQTKDPDLARSFRDCATQRARFAANLQSCVAPYGIVPASTNGSTKGEIHRGWMTFREAINYEDEKVILAEVSKGEKAALHDFEQALKKPELPADVRPLLSQQVSELRSALNHWELLYGQT